MPKEITEDVRARIFQLREQGSGYKTIGWRLKLDSGTVRKVCRELGVAVVMRSCDKCGSVIANAALCPNCRLEEAVGPEVFQPCEPTDSLPGTWARVEVYRLRIQNNQALFHDDDANDFLGAAIAPRPGAKDGTRIAPIEERAHKTTDEHVVRKDLGTH